MVRRLLAGLGLRKHRLATCGHTIGQGRTFQLGADGRARSVGIEKCSNARLCPVCGPAISAVRAAEVGAAVWRWLEADDEHFAVFVSITGAHRASDRLATLHDQWMTARERVMSSQRSAWRTFKREHGIVDSAAVIEHSFGANGPHPGLHMVLLLDRWWDAEEAQRVGSWLLVELQRELRQVGFTGRLAPSSAIDLAMVDDPAGLGRYLTKWGIGRELAGQATKTGRNGTNVPYASIPTVLAHQLANRDPHHAARTDRQIARLVEAWTEFFEVATSDRRRWYRGFHHLNRLVPELRGVTSPLERIAVATAVLPEQLRPDRHDDAEQTDDNDQEGDTAPVETLTVDPALWRAAERAWWRPSRLPLSWHLRCRRWVGDRAAAPITLELAVCWLIEDHGIDAAEALLDQLTTLTATG